MLRIRNAPDGRLDRIALWLERRSAVLAAALLAAMLLVAIGGAAHKVLWYDELVTTFTASLPTWGAIWRFYASGLDTTGPVQSFVARLGLGLPLAPEIAVRLPFMVAFLCMCAGMYGFVRRRYAAGYALAALAMPMVLPALFQYIIEARAYALMLGATGLGLNFWQAAAAGKARPWSILGLWLALASAIAAHFFAIFLLVPFAAAQLAQDWPRRRPDWLAWLALLLFPAGFLPFLHGAEMARVYYAARFHAKPGPRFIEVPYRELYTSYGWIIISVLLLLAVWLLLSETGHEESGRESAPASQGFTRAEWILVGSLALLPVYEVLGSVVLGVDRPQYAIEFYVGFIVAVVAAFAEVVRRRRPAGALALIAVLVCAVGGCAHNAFSGIQALLHPSRVHAAAVAQVEARPWMQHLPDSPLPVALDCNSYMDLAYYGTPQFHQRAYALVDPAGFDDPANKESVTNQQNMMLFSRMLPIHYEDIDGFLARNPHFIAVTSFDEHEWLPSYLLNRQRTKGDLTVTMIFYDAAGSLLDVQMK
jgi:hypothetical protein